MMEDRVLTLLVLAVTAGLGLNTLADRTPTVDATPGIEQHEPLDGRVADIAEAIAIAEGFYAPGDHDGHSLPFRLNNPGALKKPALGAEDLPAWEDTGLVIFPTVEMGWAALHHQVRLMLSGESRIYHPSDDLFTVATKYTGGDESFGWSSRVASSLGVALDATLADLVRRREPRGH